MRTITYTEALTALNEAVKTKGYKHTYQREGQFAGCYNVTLAGKPDCIVGHALIWLGIPAEWFLESEPEEDGDSRRGTSAGQACRLLTDQNLFGFEPSAVDLFIEAQVSQDNGVAWGEAVAKAHLGRDLFDEMRLWQDVEA